MTDVLIEGVNDKEGRREIPLNILLVEDDKSVVPMIKMVLKGHNITVFDNVEQALGKLRESKRLGVAIDWIITDRGLVDDKGGIDKEGGFKLAEAIREEQLGNPFVTLYTGSAPEVQQQNSAEQLEKRGIHQVIAKTSKPSEFVLATQLVREFGKQSQVPQVNKI